MVETTKNPGEKTLSVTPTKTLTLKPRGVEQGVVRQSFSHGRTKAVVVEKVKRRVGGPVKAEAPTTTDGLSAKRSATARPAVVPPTAAPATVPAQSPAVPSPKPSGVVLRTLTEDEQKARVHALADARLREAEERKIAEEEAHVGLAREASERTEREAAEARKRGEEDRRRHDEETKRKAELEAKKRFGGEDTAAAARPAARPVLEADEEEGPRTTRRGGVIRPATPPKPTRTTAEKSRRRLTVVTALTADEVRERSVASFRRRVQRMAGHRDTEPKEKLVREVIIPETITIQELANRMAERGVDVIRLLMRQGQMVKITDVIDADTAQLLAEEMGHTVKRVAESDVLEGLKGADDDATHLVSRPPVVTVMGHVDHGKTSLLDALRKTDVVSGEAGGITQHIGAYQVTLKGGQKITFLDTPGHAAFTAMRGRGAKVTDLVILVVAADDGVMPQTVEAIAHAKAAHVPLIVAVNKIDKGDANAQRVKTELLQHEIQVEELGGETLAIEVSATKGINLDKLEEAILLQAEVLDLKANPERSAEGAVIEAKLDRGRGPVATVLVQRGTLKVGDIVVAGSEWGRVRVLQNDRGETVTSAGLATPIEVLGLSGTPEAGDEMVVVENEARAREVTEYRARKRREARQASSSRQTLDQLLKTRDAGEKRLLPLVIKADVQGSSEAIQGALAKLGTDEVGVQVLQSGVGGITESDVILAHASGAGVIGFNVRADKLARERAKRDGVDIRYYNIIYNVVDDIKAVLSGMLAPEVRERLLGNAQILEVFTISKVGKVAGCRVTDGSVRRGARVRLIRDNVVIHEGELSTLKRFKDEVREVQTGQECGMAFANYQDMQKGDVIECFEVETIQRAL